MTEQEEARELEGRVWAAALDRERQRVAALEAENVALRAACALSPTDVDHALWHLTGKPDDEMPRKGCKSCFPCGDRMARAALEAKP
jgi:hypothetical protein